MKLKIVGLAALLALAGCNHESHETKEPIAISICEIVRNTAKFDGHRLVVQASLISNGIDRSVLSDDRCARVALLLVPAKRESDDSVRKLRETLVNDGRSATDHRKVRGTFAGHFRVSAGPVKRYTFELESVKDVVVSRSP